MKRSIPTQLSAVRSLATITADASSRSTQEPDLILKDKERPLRIDRDLPDPREDRAKQIMGFVGFSIAMTASLALIFNYEKTESPIIETSLYQLRRSPVTKELLGENIEFSGIIPWVYGELNPVKGKINIKFYIKGDNKVPGVVRLVADRENRAEQFLIHEWSLTVNDKQFDLLTENTITVE